MNRFKWWLAGILTVVAVTASAKMVVNGYLEKAGFETAAADPVLNLFTGRMYYNTTSNTVKFYNGATWGDVGSGLSVPTGTIAPQVGTTVPAGWLAADGACLVTATYPALQAEIVTGGWDQTGCAGGEFRMPDLRNRYIRGTGTQGADGFGGVSVALGVAQDDATAENNMNIDGAPGLGTLDVSPSTVSTGGHTHAVGTYYGQLTMNASGVLFLRRDTTNITNWTSDRQIDPDPGGLIAAAVATTGLAMAGSSAAGPSSNTSVTGAPTVGSLDVTSSDTETSPKSYGVNYIIKT